MGCCASKHNKAGDVAAEPASKVEVDPSLDRKFKDRKTGNSQSKAAPASSYSQIVVYNDVISETGICAGCHDIVGGMFEMWKSNGKQVGSALEVAKNIHESFIELSECARRCLSCRVLRQALLLRQTSLADEEALYDPAQQQRITARLLSGGSSGEPSDSAEVVLQISLNGSEDYAKSAYIGCSSSRKLDIDYISLPRWEEDLDCSVFRSWLTTCNQHHSRACGELRWTNANPTRLIEILDAKIIRLIDAGQRATRLDYMALSYSWGGKTSSSTHSGNLSSRTSAFPVTDLTKTLRDAIELARRVGTQYVWIDALCIVQANPTVVAAGAHDPVASADFAKEAPRMHEYYGNACFTLCIGSGLHADEKFLRERGAWKWGQLQTSIRWMRIFNFDTDLRDARQAAPYTTRAWCLQEEYLSPRRLYWFNQTTYWSCSEALWAEGLDGEKRRPRRSEEGEMRERMARQPNTFLGACFELNRAELHNIWLGVVQSYVRRNLTNANDKFQALSGVASRYFSATQVGRRKNRYIAGLWLNTFARDLVWKMQRAKGRADQSQMDEIAPPSWSWASLPVKSEIEYQVDFSSSAAFEVVDEALEKSPNAEEEGIERHVEIGSQVTSIRVKGRIRPFWAAQSRPVDWAAVRVAGSNEDGISFRTYRAEDVYSANVETGQLAVAQAHTQHMKAQLDYRDDAILVSNGSIQLDCLEVGQRAMLLLAQERKAGTYRRVGVCYSTRDFFEDYDVQEIQLI